MKFGLRKYKVMRLGQSERRPQFDYYVVGNKLQLSVCNKD